MKKVLSIFVVALFIAGLSNAQGLKFGVGAYVGLPMGNFGDVTSVGFGGLVQGEMNLAPQIDGIAQVGYLAFTGKSVNGVDLGNWGIIPINVGAKYFFAPNFYGTANIALNFISWTAKVPTFNYSTLTITYSDQTENDTKFGFGIGAGYELGKIDLAVKYQSFASDASAVSLTAIYKFTL